MGRTSQLILDFASVYRKGNPIRVEYSDMIRR